MLCFVFAALVVLLDQLFKRWIVLTLMVNEETVLIRGIVNLYHTNNPGAAFSILPDQRWLLAAISFVAAIVLIAILLRYNEGFWGTLGLASVLGGAVGNLIDRVFHGYVVDMFRFTFMNIDFAIFNIADIFITLGMITFCIFFIVSSFRSGGGKEEAPASEFDEYDNAGIEQYDRSKYIQEPQTPEDVDYSKLFYGDSATDGYTEPDFSLPPEYFEPAHAQEQFIPPQEYFEPAPKQNDYYAADQAPVYYEPAQTELVSPDASDYYDTVQGEPQDYYGTEPERQVYYGTAEEPPGDATPTLDALKALESELNEADLLADYNIDDILREYGFEDDKN